MVICCRLQYIGWPLVITEYWIRRVYGLLQKGFSRVLVDTYPDSKVHVANMGPTWVLSAPDGPHVGHMNLAIRISMLSFGINRSQWMKHGRAVPSYFIHQWYLSRYSASTWCQDISRHCAEYIFSVIQSSAIITRSNLSWYHIGHCNNNDRKWIRY